MRAHGDSQKIAWGHRISRYAKDVEELIEALGLENVVLLGWSMGASVVWSYLDLFDNKHLAGHVSVDQSPHQYYDETCAGVSRDAATRNRWLFSRSV